MDYECFQIQLSAQNKSLRTNNDKLSYLLSSKVKQCVPIIKVECILGEPIEQRQNIFICLKYQVLERFVENFCHFNAELFATSHLLD